jgi:hypothetical protein
VDMDTVSSSLIVDTCRYLSFLSFLARDVRRRDIPLSRMACVLADAEVLRSLEGATVTFNLRLLQYVRAAHERRWTVPSTPPLAPLSANFMDNFTTPHMRVDIRVGMKIVQCVALICSYSSILRLYCGIINPVLRPSCVCERCRQRQERLAFPLLSERLHRINLPATIYI